MANSSRSSGEVGNTLCVANSSRSSDEVGNTLCVANSSRSSDEVGNTLCVANSSRSSDAWPTAVGQVMRLGTHYARPTAVHRSGSEGSE